MSNNNFSNKPDQVAGNGYFDQVSVGGGGIHIWRRYHK